VSDPIFRGRLKASVSEVVDGGDLVPDHEMVALAVLEGQERPGEDPSMRRRLRYEGIRPREHRGALLLEPGEMERASSAGLLEGTDEVFFMQGWDEEFEPFPGRISADLADFQEGLPHGIEDWMHETGCVLALGDGGALNYATTSAEIHQRLVERFRAAKR
jgi:hypothetical protein